jgi:hypothetical protein
MAFAGLRCSPGKMSCFPNFTAKSALFSDRGRGRSRVWRGRCQGGRQAWPTASLYVIFMTYHVFAPILAHATLRFRHVLSLSDAPSVLLGVSAHSRSVSIFAASCPCIAAFLSTNGARWAASFSRENELFSELYRQKWAVFAPGAPPVKSLEGSSPRRPSRLAYGFPIRDFYDLSRFCPYSGSHNSPFSTCPLIVRCSQRLGRGVCALSLRFDFCCFVPLYCCLLEHIWRSLGCVVLQGK